MSRHFPRVETMDYKTVETPFYATRHRELFIGLTGIFVSSNVERSRLPVDYRINAPSIID